MTQLKSHLAVTVAVFVLAFAAWIGSEARRATVQTQEVDRVLEIERYPEEPLQLVNLRIGTQSVKDRIKQKFKDPNSKWGIDHVKFNEKDDWVKRLSITMRNTSDKPIYGVQGLLFFKPTGFPMMFGLQLTGSRRLRHDPLQPGTDIELSVNQDLLNERLEDAKNKGADLRGAVVSFSLEMVAFSDKLRWYRGHLVRPDSTVPDKWVPVDDPLVMKGNKPPVKSASASFVKASFESKVRVRSVGPIHPPPMVFVTCQQYNGSFQGVSCPGDPSDCIVRTDIADNPNPGLYSHNTFSDRCVDRSELGLSCAQTGTHTRMQFDANCQPCPDADGDGYQAKSCGGTDCNDSVASIHPNATENCTDGIDNDCNGLTDEADLCSCGILYEGPVYLGGGEIDCSLCADTVDNDCDGFKDIYDSDCWGFCLGSPVLIDVSGNGFDLTSAANGVSFDLNNDGTKEKLSWTAPETDDAWLALDRNGDGTINNGTELFGNFTPQPNPPFGFGRNGFNALVEYDKVANGGNGDGLINTSDAIFDKLLLWQDKNHNGVSEPNERNTMKQLGLNAIECNYKEAKRRDQYGNQFRYRAKVTDVRNAQVGRWAWDVFLVNDRNSSMNALLDPIGRKNSGSILDWLRK